MDPKLVGFVRNYLRAGTFRWHTRSPADKRFKTVIGKFKNGNDKTGKACGICDGKFPTKETQMDHIVPVIGVNGFQDFHIMILRMFPDEFTWARVCKPCHEIKTKEETDYRTKWRKATAEEKVKIKTEFDKKWEDLKEEIKRKYP